MPMMMFVNFKLGGGLAILWECFFKHIVKMVS